MTTSRSTNPLRQPIPRGVAFKTTAWNANADGKDASTGKNVFAMDDEFVWLARHASVPLAWITSAEARGPGFVVAWRNPISGADEHAIACIRTFFGYDTKKRDEIVARLRRAVASRRDVRETAAAPKTEAPIRCERCGGPAQASDLNWFATVGPFWIQRLDRRVLCRRHARGRFRLVAISNTLTSPWGIGLFMAPFVGLANVSHAQSSGAIEATEAAAWRALAFVPWLPIVAMLAFTVHYVATF